MKAFIILSLLIGSNAFALNEVLLKQQASATLALAFPEAKPTHVCELGLSSDDAPANVGLMIATLFNNNQPLTIILYKTVSAAGASQTANIRVYPFETLEDRKTQLAESASSLGATELKMGTCYNM